MICALLANGFISCFHVKYDVLRVRERLKGEAFDRGGGVGGGEGRGAYYQNNFT